MSLQERMLGMRPRPPRAALLRERMRGSLVVITGASRGVGAECARRLARAGAHVVLVARSRDALERVAGDIRAAGGIADVVVLDLRDSEATEAAARELLASHGVPDVVVSNAGHSIHRALDEYADRPHDLPRLLGVNLLGPVALLRVLLPAMHARGSGRVVSVSSVSAVVPAAGWSAYGASKAAADAWFSSIAQELAPSVRVSIVRLPLVRTAMIAATPGYREAPAMRPVDAVVLIARAIVTGRRILAPWWLPPLGAVLSLWPGALDSDLRRRERMLRRAAQ